MKIDSREESGKRVSVATVGLFLKGLEDSSTHQVFMGNSTLSLISLKWLLCLVAWGWNWKSFHLFLPLTASFSYFQYSNASNSNCCFPTCHLRAEIDCVFTKYCLKWLQFNKRTSGALNVLRQTEKDDGKWIKQLRGNNLTPRTVFNHLWPSRRLLGSISPQGFVYLICLIFKVQLTASDVRLLPPPWKSPWRNDGTFPQLPPQLPITNYQLPPWKCGGMCVCDRRLFWYLRVLCSALISPQGAPYISHFHPVHWNTLLMRRFCKKKTIFKWILL